MMVSRSTQTESLNDPPVRTWNQDQLRLEGIKPGLYFDLECQILEIAVSQSKEFQPHLKVWDGTKLSTPCYGMFKNLKPKFCDEETNNFKHYIATVYIFGNHVRVLSRLKTHQLIRLRNVHSRMVTGSLVLELYDGGSVFRRGICFMESGTDWTCKLESMIEKAKRILFPYLDQLQDEEFLSDLDDPPEKNLASSQNDKTDSNDNGLNFEDCNIDKIVEQRFTEAIDINQLIFKAPVKESVATVNENVEIANEESMNEENMNKDNVNEENMNVENVNGENKNEENVNEENMNVENVNEENMNVENVNDENMNEAIVKESVAVVDEGETVNEENSSQNQVGSKATVNESVAVVDEVEMVIEESSSQNQVGSKAAVSESVAVVDEVEMVIEESSSQNQIKGSNEKQTSRNDEQEEDISISSMRPPCGQTSAKPKIFSLLKISEILKFQNEFSLGSELDASIPNVKYSFRGAIVDIYPRSDYVEEAFHLRCKKCKSTFPMTYKNDRPCPSLKNQGGCDLVTSLQFKLRLCDPRKFIVDVLVAEENAEVFFWGYSAQMLLSKKLAILQLAVKKLCRTPCYLTANSLVLHCNLEARNQDFFVVDTKLICLCKFPKVI